MVPYKEYIKNGISIIEIEYNLNSDKCKNCKKRYNHEIKMNTIMLGLSDMFETHYIELVDRNVFLDFEGWEGFDTYLNNIKNSTIIPNYRKFLQSYAKNDISWGPLTVKDDYIHKNVYIEFTLWLKLITHCKLKDPTDNEKQIYMDRTIEFYDYLYDTKWSN